MTFKRFQLRGKENFLKYVAIELQLLKAEWKIILPCVIMQYIHGVFHNLAYWVQGHKLSLEQRFVLHDLGFSLMPELSESNSHFSEYLVFGGVFAPAIFLVLTIPLFRQNPQKPRYMVIVLKRVLLHISIALIFRICSFMLTTLPGPARQCRLDFDETCVAQTPRDDILKCVIPNPDFKPPHGHEFFTNMDALNGCGDLMFSSHTIYTMSFILTAIKYWPNRWLLLFFACVQIAIAFLIVASRKHYSLDVFSALYIVPLLWLTHDAYYKDINHKDVGVSVKTIHEFYGIDVSEEVGGEFHHTQPLDSVQVATAEEGFLTESEGNAQTEFQRKNSM
uniref:Sphingomyelin synthase-like domain-containing protein n=1 Tax=Globisporangium ultimum (strain ATCC 200006 / CBS 805.95 / DAOM BR144) TaxID=431595 RepID=K3WU09_GLOUD